MHPEHTLYIVSPIEPDLQHIVEQAGWSTSGWDATDYSRFLDQLRLGQEWGFRLRANPVRSKPAPGSARGKVLPHVTPAQQLSWLESKSSKLGFSLPREEQSTDEPGTLLTSVTQRQDRRFSRKSSLPSSHVTLRQAQFDGVLSITDLELFRTTLINGIGRGKAYGCGLMTLRRV